MPALTGHVFPEVQRMPAELRRALLQFEKLEQYTPVTNLTLGTGGTNIAYSHLTGSMLVAYGRVLFGTTPTVGATITMELPPGYQFTSTIARPIGYVHYAEAGGDDGVGIMQPISVDTFQFYCFDKSGGGSFVTETAAGTTAPHTWGAGDAIEWQIVAEVFSR